MPGQSSIRGYAAYLPRAMLSTARFGALPVGVPARRARSVAWHDEDAVTLAVEAARRLGADAGHDAALVFATSTAPWLDKSAAATVHAALESRRRRP